jgi:hypothetical protein
MNETPITELLSAYLDGELTAEEQARVEQALAADPSARQLLDELRAVGTSLQALPQYKLDDDMSQRVLDLAARRMLVGNQVDRQAESGGLKEDDANGVKPLWKELNWRDMLSRRALAWSGTAVAVAILLYWTDPTRQQNPMGNRQDNRELALRDQDKKTVVMKTSQMKLEKSRALPLKAAKSNQNPDDRKFDKVAEDRRLRKSAEATPYSGPTIQAPAIPAPAVQAAAGDGSVAQTPVMEQPAPEAQRGHPSPRVFASRAKGQAAPPVGSPPVDMPTADKAEAGRKTDNEAVIHEELARPGASGGQSEEKWGDSKRDSGKNGERSLAGESSEKAKAKPTADAPSSGVVVKQEGVAPASSPAPAMPAAPLPPALGQGAEGALAGKSPEPAASKGSSQHSPQGPSDQVAVLPEQPGMKRGALGGRAIPRSGDHDLGNLAAKDATKEIDKSLSSQSLTPAIPTDGLFYNGVPGAQQAQTPPAGAASGLAASNLCICVDVTPKAAADKTLDRLLDQLGMHGNTNQNFGQNLNQSPSQKTGKNLGLNGAGNIGTAQAPLQTTIATRQTIEVDATVDQLVALLKGLSGNRDAFAAVSFPSDTMRFENRRGEGGQSLDFRNNVMPSKPGDDIAQQPRSAGAQVFLSQSLQGSATGSMNGTNGTIANVGVAKSASDALSNSSANATQNTIFQNQAVQGNVQVPSNRTHIVFELHVVDPASRAAPPPAAVPAPHH